MGRSKETHPPQRGTPGADRDSMSIYLSEIAQEEFLSRAEEVFIFEEFRKAQKEISHLLSFHRSVLARDHIEAARTRLEKCRVRLIKSNLYLVVSIAKNFQGRGIALADLVNEGNIGLIEAISRYDVGRGLRFSTYGTWWVKQSIQKFLAKQERLIRVPVSVQEFVKRCLKVEEILSQRYGRRPYFKEIAEYIGEKEKKVCDSYEAFKDTASLDSPPQEGDMTPLVELLSSKTENQETTWLRETLVDALRYLTCRERQIIILRYGLQGNEAWTLKTTGNALGITQERVRQLERRALEKLRKFTPLKEFN